MRNGFSLAAALLVLAGVTACQLQADAARSHPTPPRLHRSAGAVARPCALSGCDVHWRQPPLRATEERALLRFPLRQEAIVERTTRLAEPEAPEPDRDAAALAGISIRPHPIVQGYP